MEVSAAKWQFDENLMPPTQTSANFSFSPKNLILSQIQINIHKHIFLIHGEDIALIIGHCPFVTFHHSPNGVE